MALFPASAALVGSILITPSPSVWIPGLSAELGLVGRLGWTVPQTSRAKAAYQWVLFTVGWAPCVGFWSS